MSSQSALQMAEITTSADRESVVSLDNTNTDTRKSVARAPRPTAHELSTYVPPSLENASENVRHPTPMLPILGLDAGASARISAARPTVRS